MKTTKWRQFHCGGNQQGCKGRKEVSNCSSSSNSSSSWMLKWLNLNMVILQLVIIQTLCHDPLNLALMSRKLMKNRYVLTSHGSEVWSPKIDRVMIRPNSLLLGNIYDSVEVIVWDLCFIWPSPLESWRKIDMFRHLTEVWIPKIDWGMIHSSSLLLGDVYGPVKVIVAHFSIVIIWLSLLGPSVSRPESVSGWIRLVIDC